MIKFGIRQNLYYPFMLIIFSTLRQILSILMDEKIEFDASLILEFIMFLSEFSTGLILAIYNKKLMGNKKEINKDFMGIKLIIEDPEMYYPDNSFKLLFLIFAAGFFDFIQFSIETYYIQKINNDLYKFFEIPLRSILITGCSALLCIFLLKFKIQKHQKYSLFIILACFIIVIITNNCFMFISKNISNDNWYFVICLIFINYFFSSLIDVIEKYLLEYKFINPYLILMLEGITGLLLSSFYFLIENPFKDIKKFHNKNNKTKFGLLIISLILYFIFSGGKNLYRIITNKVFSPMAWTLIDSIFDPFKLIYNFYFSDEKLDEQNILFFIINILISIIIIFCACIYNELFVLYCCNLHINTYFEISRRASSEDFLDYILGDDDDDDIIL